MLVDSRGQVGRLGEYFFCGVVRPKVGATVESTGVLSATFALACGVQLVNREAMAAISCGRKPADTANEGLGDIDDKVWAKCIASWPKAVDLTLLPNAGNASVAAANDLEYLINITFRNTGLTETDLQLLRGHKSLLSLWVVEDGQSVKYLDQQGTGIWQREAEEDKSETVDGAE